MLDLEECLRSRKIVRIDPTPAMVEKEMEGSLYDLRRARDSIMMNDPKWASIQSYYSMFHAGKALLLQKGFREKSHACLLEGLKTLYVVPEEIDGHFIQDLEDSMFVRLDADYGLVFKEDVAKMMVEKAEAFYNESRKLIDRKTVE